MYTLDKKIIVVIEGPSGVGKDTIINEMIKRYPDLFEKAISVTTRQMRENEVQGNPYQFVDEQTFLGYIKNKDIFEHTIRHGTYRGMRKENFEKILNKNKIPLKDCDIIGLNALKQIYNKMVLGIFITAPKSEVEKRLIGRNEPSESIKNRLNDYDNCMLQSKYFDLVINNYDINNTIEIIMNAINNF